MTIDSPMAHTSFTSNVYNDRSCMQSQIIVIFGFAIPRDMKAYLGCHYNLLLKSAINTTKNSIHRNSCIDIHHGHQLKVEENDSTSKMRAVGLHTNPTDQVPELDCVILWPAIYNSYENWSLKEICKPCKYQTRLPWSTLPPKLSLPCKRDDIWLHH